MQAVSEVALSENPVTGKSVRLFGPVHALIPPRLMGGACAPRSKPGNYTVKPPPDGQNACEAQGDGVQAGLGLKPISRHRHSLFQAAASRLWAVPAPGTGPAGVGCGQCAGDGPVVGSVARADAAVVLTQGHLHDPVAGVFDGPVAHRLQQRLGLGGQRGPQPAGPPGGLAPDVRPGIALLDGHPVLSAGVPGTGVRAETTRCCRNPPKPGPAPP